MKRSTSFLAVALLFVPLAFAQAQTTTTRTVPARTLSGGTAASRGATAARPGTAIQAPVPAKGATPAAGVPPTATPAAPTPPTMTRLQAFAKIQIDRRPSSMLKAWSDAAKKPDEEKPKEDDKKGDDKKADDKKEDDKKEDDKKADDKKADDKKADDKKADDKKADDKKADDKKDPMAPAANPAAPATPANPFADEVEEVRKQIVTGKWDAFAKYLAELEDKTESFNIYKSLLTKFATPPKTGPQPTQSAGRAYAETNVYSVDDLFGILRATPTPHDDASVQSVARLVATAIRNGNTVNLFLGKLSKAVEEAAKVEEPNFTRRHAAKLLKGAALTIHLADFLPTVEEAEKEDDAEALNLLSDLYMARYRKESEQGDLEEAWRVVQLVLASDAADDASQQRALTQAVSLSSTVRKELGQQWLDNSFSADTERGMRILATVGKLTSQGLMMTPTSPTTRRNNLELLSKSVEVLLDKSPDLGEEWQGTLTLLAFSWLKESELSYRLDQSATRGQIMRYDSFGNPYFISQQQYTQQYRSSNSARSISVADLLKHRPSDKWIALLDESLQPRFEESLAKLFLKVQEEENAFPYIEKLAESQPDIAKTLVNEFLTVWANNHDPNSGRRMTSPIFRIYGFSQRAEGIPLTRSKQERNLAELSKWLKRLKALPVWDDVDEKLLVRAFTVCHSSAEVYELDSIEGVFGDIELLDPLTIAGLAQRMRSNLAGLWREPDTQKQNKTNRRKKDIEAEVMRGYQVADQVIENALKQHEGNWALMLAKAALMHDAVNYQQEVAKSSKFTEQRLEALQAFRDAADAYAQKVVDIDEEKETVQPYQLWYYASLGACDLRQLDAEKLPLLAEPPQIREAIMSLPPDIAERHMSKFANGLFTNLRSVSPAVKYRYLKNGFAIVGEHEQAIEAKKVFDYYDDLVTEIELHAEVDGSTNVGHEKPFGIFINLRHTREIERESGGFGRYLQNQNNVQYSYNYGRPTENYRDKFEEGLRGALSEHFEVESVTFQSEDVTSKADAEYGWRTTSYAYVMVKARSEEIDRIPPIKLDLDFLETSGYVVLPIESPMVPIDATAAKEESRPADVLSVVQTLDERQAKDGKLILEIKASTHGLTPELEDLVELKPEEFTVAGTDDQGNSVSRFDPDADQTAIITERLWTITFEGRKDLAELPEQFSFATVLVDAKESLFQRYVDADLETVEQTISLEQSYGQTDNTMLIVMSSIVGIGLIGLVGMVLVLSRKRESSDARSIHLPHDITPFSVIGVLREIHQKNGLSPDQKDQLAEEIHKLEGAYFAPEASRDADLKSVAERWLRRARV